MLLSIVVIISFTSPLLPAAYSYLLVSITSAMDSGMDKISFLLFSRVSMRAYIIVRISLSSVITGSFSEVICTSSASAFSFSIVWRILPTRLLLS